MTVPDLDADDYAAMVQQLMPPGPIWSDADSILPGADSILGTFDRLLEGRTLGRISGGALEPTVIRDLVALSLFTWRRATDDDALPVGMDRQGWWADPTLGSRLWLLTRAKLTVAAVASAARYCEEALAWLVTAGVASRVTVDVERQGARLALRIGVARPRDPQALERYAFTWSTT